MPSQALVPVGRGGFNLSRPDSGWTTAQSREDVLGRSRLHRELAREGIIRQSQRRCTRRWCQAGSCRDRCFNDGGRRVGRARGARTLRNKRLRTPLVSTTGPAAISGVTRALSLRYAASLAACHLTLSPVEWWTVFLNQSRSDNLRYANCRLPHESGSSCDSPLGRRCYAGSASARRSQRSGRSLLNPCRYPVITPLSAKARFPGYRPARLWRSSLPLLGLR